MKAIIIFFLMLSAGSFSYAAQINSGRFNAKTQKVELNVSYGGGCAQHSFELQLVGGCAESMPVKCYLNLVHSTDQQDLCRKIIVQNLELNLPEGMLTENYYRRALLNIRGDGNSFLSIDSNRAFVTVFGGDTISFRLSRPCPPPDLPAGKPWIVPAPGESCPRIPICEGLEGPPPCYFGP